MKYRTVVTMLLPLVWAQDNPTRGLVGPPDSVIRGQATPGTIHVVTVGIDKYKSFPPLLVAEKDAKDVAQLLEQRFGYKVDAVLLGHQATKANIWTTLYKIGGTLRANDSVIVFFAMHGEKIPCADYHGCGFLIPFDADVNARTDQGDPKRWDDQAINMQRVAEWARTLKCQHVLLLADACHSGFLGIGVRGTQLPANLEMLWNGKSRVAIFAATKDQFAFEGAGNSLFTGALKTVLSTESAISATELAVRVQKLVSAAARGLTSDTQKGYDMLPLMRPLDPSLDGEFVFIARQGPVSSVNELFALAMPAMKRFLVLRGSDTRMQDLFAAIDDGPRYRYGVKRIEKDRYWKERIKQLESSATVGDVLAMAALHYVYQKGLGTTADPQLAYYWAQQAYDTGSSVGLHVLGRSFRDGIGIEANPELGTRLIAEAARAGFVVSTIGEDENQKQIVNVGRDAKENISGIKVLQAAADAGYRFAKYTLASALAVGVPGVPQNVSQGIALMTALAEQDYPPAQLSMWRLYAFGQLEQPKNVRAAAQWLTRGAETGDRTAQGFLAAAYYKWDGDLNLVQKNCAEAKRWAELAAVQGDTESMRLLATIYERGDCAAMNYAKAREFIEAAVRHNSPEAIAIQAQWYLQGTVYPRDDYVAVSLANRAAMMGNSGAMYLLGFCYDNLRGVTQPPVKLDEVVKWRPFFRVKALHWYIQAAKRGERDALKRLKDNFAGHIWRSSCGAAGNCNIYLQQDYPSDWADLIQLLGFTPEYY